MTSVTSHRVVWPVSSSEKSISKSQKRAPIKVFFGGRRRRSLPSPPSILSPSLSPPPSSPRSTSIPSNSSNNAVPRHVRSCRRGLPVPRGPPRRPGPRQMRRRARAGCRNDDQAQHVQVRGGERSFLFLSFFLFREQGGIVRARRWKSGSERRGDGF